jgi:ABC-type branched-subunit amino acid transport system ATPase component
MNELNVIALIGPGSCGKTTTLNMLYSTLLAGDVSPTRSQEGGNPNDFSDIIIWNDLRIAFFTMGDFSRGIVGAIRWADQENCNFLIVAINDQFVRPFQVLQQFQNVQIRKVKVQDKSQRAIANRAIADQIMNLLV